MRDRGRVLAMVIGGLLLGAPVAAAQATITGRVTDSQTLGPLSGILVHIAALELGGLTNGNGIYQLTNVPAGTHTVEATRLGYGAESQQVTVVAGQTLQMNFTLVQQALALDAVIITGTPGGTQRRAIGNVVSQVDIDEVLVTNPTPRVESIIGNRVAGVRMLASPAEAGGTTQLRIRGNSSLSLPNEPLIYVDGVRLSSRDEFVSRSGGMSRLADIDPATIESVEIIKGPAAATLYGTEASNGVIQIITKRGAEGSATFNASVELGRSWMPNPAEKMGRQYFRRQSDTDFSEFRSVRDESENIQSISLYELLAEKDGRDPFQQGLSQRYNLGVSGGTDLVRYFAAFTRTDTEGVTRQDWDRGNRGQVSLTILPRSDLRFDVRISRVARETRAPNNAWSTISTLSQPLPNLRGTHPPYQARLDYRTDIRSSDRTTWSLEASHTPVEWFTHRLQGGVDDAEVQRVDFTPRNAEFGRWFDDALLGEKSVTIVDTPTRTLDYAASVTLPLMGELTSTTSFGLQYYNQQASRAALTGENFATSGLSTVTAAAERSSTETFEENTTVGTFVQAMLGWENRRFVTAAVRADDNSAFGEEFSAAIYPKLSAAWVLSEEDFWPADGLLGIGQFRLRSAWGQAGMQPDAFAAHRLYQPETGPGNQPVFTALALGNPELGPERGSELEVGFDAATPGGRVQVEFTYFDRVTRDAIVAVPIRASVGFSGNQFQNIGQASNWGTETEVDIQAVARDPVRWDLSLALTTLGNRIDDLGGQEMLVVPTLVPGLASRAQYHVEGFPMASLFDRVVVQAEFTDGPGSPVNFMCDGGTGRRGMEQGGQPVDCADAPLLFLGRVEPTWMVSLTSSWTLFQSWALTANIDAATGHHFNGDYLAGANTRHSRPHIFQDDPFFEAYRVAGRSTPVTYKSGFAKLREVSLSYSLPGGMLERIGVSNASISMSAYNSATLWTQQKFAPTGQRIFDPELHSPESTFGGVNLGASPPMSSASLRVNASF